MDNNNAHLLNFVNLAKATDGGPATVNIVISALKHKQIFFYGELLDLPCVQKMRGTPEYELLDIFAFGTYETWLGKKNSLPQLTDIQLLKLRQLTVVQITSSCGGSLAYSTCQNATGISSIREVEDLVISCVYADLIRARLDQKNRRIVVDWVVGRDVRLDALDSMLAKLDSWCGNADLILNHLKSSHEHAENVRTGTQLLHNDVKQRAERMKGHVAIESESMFQNKQSKSRPGDYSDKMSRGMR